MVSGGITQGSRLPGRGARSPGTAVLLTCVLTLVAYVAVSDGRWPEWTVLSALSLATVPAMVRFGLVLESARDTMTISAAPALLFAFGVGTHSGVFPVWSVLVIVSHLVFFDSVHGLRRGCAEVISGAAMIAAASRVDLGLWPLDTSMVAVTVYLATLSLLRVLRVWSPVGVPLLVDAHWISATTVVLFLNVSFVMFALVRSSHELDPQVATIVTALGCIVTVITAQVVLTRLDILRRGAVTLTKATAAAPWPAERIDELLCSYVMRAIRASSAQLQSERGERRQLSVRLPGGRYLIAQRRRGDLPFSAADRRVAISLATIAHTSREYAHQTTRLRREAATDDLTGLMTFARFRERVTNNLNERAPGDRVALIFADLDGVKILNTELGHLVTDQVLAGIGQRIRERLPATIAASRFGGDEFVFFARDLSGGRTVQDVVSLVHAMLAEPVVVGDQVVRVAPSMGVAVSTDLTEDTDTVIERAEVRMRASKKSGSTAPEWTSTRAMVDRLAGADQLDVAFQPLVELSSGEVRAIEALVRPTRIDAMTAAIARRAISVAEDAAQLVGNPFTVVINIEPEQLLEDSDLVRSLAAMASTTDVRVVLELSERRFRRWTVQQNAASTFLQRNGIDLAIDHFGSGPGSFAMLTCWDWAWVKVDPRVLRVQDQSGRTLSRTAQLLGSFGRPTVAQGIETAAELETAVQLGMTYAQGTWLMAPATGPDLLKALGTTSRLATPGATGSAPSHRHVARRDQT